MRDGHDADVGLYKRALRLSEDGDLAAAVSTLNEAIGLRGDVPWYHHTLGEVREQQGDLGAARAAYARALSLNPVSSKYRQAVARVSARLADTAALESGPAATKPRLLVVEDSEVTRNWYERVLRADYSLSFATTARGAIRALPSVRPALILLDWQLDEDRGRTSLAARDGTDMAAELSHNSSGLDVCKQIKRSPYRHIPILMLTGKKSLIDKTLGKMARADRYLTKPVTADVLLATVRELLAHGHSGPHGVDAVRE